MAIESETPLSNATNPNVRVIKYCHQYRQKTMDFVACKAIKKNKPCPIKVCQKCVLHRNKEYVDERQRHRYEVNPDMVVSLVKAGLSFAAKDETGKRMEIVEVPSHPFFIGIDIPTEEAGNVCQFLEVCFPNLDLYSGWN